MKKIWKKFFPLRTIATKIFFSMMILTIASVLLIALTINSTYYETFRENEIRYNVLATSTIKSKFDLTMEMLSTLSDTIAGSSDIEILTQQGTAENTDEEVPVIEALLLQPYVDNIHIITKDKLIYSSMTQKKREDIYAKYLHLISDADTIPQMGSFYVNTPVEVSYYYPIRLSGNQVEGLIITDIDYDYLREMFMLSAIGLNEKVLIAGNNGEVLFGYPHTTAFEPFLNQYPQILGKDKIQTEGEVYGIDSIIVSEKMDFADWQVIRIIHSDSITYQTKEVISLLKWATVILIAVCLIYSLSVSRVITSPVKVMEEACNTVEQGNLQVRVKLDSNDEFGKLAKTFNMMLDTTENYLKEEIENEKRKADMKFQILQAQINPHFLYNTLDSIRWLAVMNNVNSIAEMTSSLIGLLKYNLTSGSASTTLRDEIESVKHYVTIQKYRYSDIFDFSISAQEEALNCKIVRFSLQPLVENSIMHGFEDALEQYYIQIVAFLSDGNLHIRVVDNGIGINPELLEELNAGEKNKKTFSQIGIANVRERIKLYFGDTASLTYTSSYGKGTVAELILPQDLKESDEQ